MLYGWLAVCICGWLGWSAFGDVFLAAQRSAAQRRGFFSPKQVGEMNVYRQVLLQESSLICKMSSTEGLNFSKEVGLFPPHLIKPPLLQCSIYYTVQQQLVAGFFE